MSLWDKAKELMAWMKDIFTPSRKAECTEMVREANKHKPDGKFYQYREEMEARHAYLIGNMQPDMATVIESRFPETHEIIEKVQVNLKIYKRTIKRKAQVFTETGEFYLIDDDGMQAGSAVDALVKDEEGKEKQKVLYEQDADNFADMIWDCRLLQSLQSADEIRRAMHRCMVKPWWDDHKGHLRVNTWPPYLVGIIPSVKPDERFDVDRAPLVYFERSGTKGPSDPKKSHEIWGIRPEEIAEDLGQETLHYISIDNGEDVYLPSDKDVNPYTDPRNEGKPIYPFIWLRDDDSTELFVFGEGDALTINRAINCILIDMTHSHRLQAFGARVHTQSENNPQPLSTQRVDAGMIIEQGPGETLEALASDLPITETLEMVKQLIEMDGKLEGLAASVISPEGLQADSGRALKIKRLSEEEDRKEQIGYIHDDIEELLARLIIVHNTHCDGAKKINPNLHPKWKPGDPAIPVDPNEENTAALAEHGMNISTPVDLRMARYQEDRATALQAVKDNAILNAELSKLGTVPVQPAFGFNAPEEEEEEMDDDGNPIPPKKGEVPPQLKKAAEEKPKEDDEEVDDDTKKKVEAADLKLNVYQLAVAILNGAATPVDMRMLIYPDESFEQAKQKVMESIEFNNEVAAILAKAKAITAEVEEGKKKKKPPEEGEE